jgi:hypothetical protein
MAATARERSVAPHPLGRCHESQSVASTAQTDAHGAPQVVSQIVRGTVKLIYRRRFSTKNLSGILTPTVTRKSAQGVLGCSLAGSVCLLSSHVARRRGASGRREMLLTACHGIVTGLCVYVCVRFHLHLRDWANIMPQKPYVSGVALRA